MPNQYRQEKLGELIAAELSDLLRTRMKDPRVGLLGSEDQQAATIQALKHATGFLRHELASRLVLRYMPALVFKLDTSIEKGTRVLQLMRELEQDKTISGGANE